MTVHPPNRQMLVSFQADKQLLVHASLKDSCFSQIRRFENTHRRFQALDANERRTLVYMTLF